MTAVAALLPLPLTLLPSFSFLLCGATGEGREEEMTEARDRRVSSCTSILQEEKERKRRRRSERGTLGIMPAPLFLLTTYFRRNLDGRLEAEQLRERVGGQYRSLRPDR